MSKTTTKAAKSVTYKLEGEIAREFAAIRTATGLLPLSEAEVIKEMRCG